MNRAFHNAWVFAISVIAMVMVVSQALAQDFALHRSNGSVHARTDASEWVVVLKDPRPRRLQGFQVRGYATHYKNSLALKRFGKQVAKRYKLNLKQAWFIESLGVYCLIVGFQGDPVATLAALKKDSMVSWVQESNEFELLSADNQVSINGLSTSAPRTTSPLDGRGVRIALIDSAVSVKHPDLGKSITLNRDLVVGGSNLQTNGERHGTAMAGIIVAEPNHPLGMRGVAPAAEVLAYRGCWETQDAKTRCNTLSLARALDGALQAQPSILNLSLTGPRDQLLDRLVDELVAQGVLVVTAFDPQRSQSDRFPSRRQGVLIVRAEHMNSEQNQEFTAPGTRIVISPDAQYTTMSGHSVATAYTTGVLALVAQAEADQEAINWRSLIDIDDEGFAQIGNVQKVMKLTQL